LNSSESEDDDDHSMNTQNQIKDNTITTLIKDNSESLSSFPKQND
jgi:hypothetical protein